MLKRFFSYIEIQTKITSTFAFLMTLAFMAYKGYTVDLRKTLVFFASMFIFDLATTAINNYIDTKTNGQQLQFNRRTALYIIFILFGISTALGIYLALITDVVVLLAGGACFIVGVLYTYGPVPISRQPLGEVLSGVFYGFFIPFILLYINTPNGTLLEVAFTGDRITVGFMLWPLFSLLLVSIPPMCATANIMLANNICDLDKDIAVKRYTLPYYLGKKALYLFAAIYYLAYGSIAAMVIFGVLHPLCLVTLLTFIPVQRNITRFMRLQDKAVTFITAIQNYVLIMGSLTIAIFISSII